MISKPPVPNGASCGTWNRCFTGGGAIGCIGVGMRDWGGCDAAGRLTGCRFMLERRSPARPAGGPGGGSVGKGPDGRVGRPGTPAAGATPTSVGRRAPGGGASGRAIGGGVILMSSLGSGGQLNRLGERR